MRIFIALIPLVLLVVWDLAANHGSWLRAAQLSIANFVRQLTG